MSHITGIDNTVIISDLKALKLAIQTFCPTMEFVEGQRHYRTWKDDHNGRLVGDWPLPAGWTAAMVGENAAHIVRIKDQHLTKGRTSRSAPYEIGVVPVTVKRAADGKVLEAKPDAKGTEYILMADWYNSGYGLLSQPGIGDRKSIKDPETQEVKESAFGALYMHYRMMETKLEAERQGDTCEFETQEDGTVVAVVDTTARLGY